MKNENERVRITRGAQRAPPVMRFATYSGAGEIITGKKIKCNC